MKFAVAMALVALTAPADAQQQRVTLSGVVDAPFAIINLDEGPDGGGNPISGLIAGGDRFALTLSFDLSDATPAFQAPSASRKVWNIPATFSYMIGSFNAPIHATSLRYTIENDYAPSNGGTLYDRNVYQFEDRSRYFDIFPALGLTSVDFTFTASDLNGTSYASSKLQAPIKPSDVERSSAFFLFYSAFNDDFAYTTSRDLSFAVAVPEPYTWTMMIVGVGLIGGTARRRKAIPARA